MAEVVQHYRPQELAVEQVFFARNAASALKLGQARGAAICAALSDGIEVYEYSPRAVKQAVVGSGGADKAQVQHMVKIILSLREDLAEARADQWLGGRPGCPIGARDPWRVPGRCDQAERSAGDRGSGDDSLWSIATIGLVYR